VTGAGNKTVSLSGTGLQQSDTVTVGSLSFGSLTVGSTSAAQGVQLTNSGNVVVTISSVTATGPYGVSTSCGSSLAVGASCTANITFTPTAMGSQPGTLTFVTSAGNQAVALSGSGNKAVLSASPTSLAFGSVVTGNTTTASFTLSNSGNVAATSLGITPSTGYTQSDNCGASLAAGASCTVTVHFSPTSAGAYNGTVTVTSATGTLSVPLSGTGVAAHPSWSFSTTSIGISSTDYSSNTANVVITNNGNTNLTFSGIASGLTAQSGDSCSLIISGCSAGQTLTPGQACTMSVQLNQTGDGEDSYTGYINVSSQAGTVQIGVSGNSMN
jgi:hypothetical protein